MRIALFGGGISSEREVSLNSVKNVKKALDNLGYEVIVVDPKYKFDLNEIKPDLVYNSLVGGWGEDGALQGLCEMYGIPYTNSGITACAITIDKELTNRVLTSYGIRCPKQEFVSKADLDNNIDIKGAKVIKALREGSSNQVEFVEDVTNLNLQQMGFTDDVLIEEYIEGREMSVGILEDKPLGVAEIEYPGRIFSNEYKYGNDAVRYHSPPDIDKEIYDYFLELTLRIHKILGCENVSRTDFRFDATKGKEGVYFIELNASPAFTNTSLLPIIAEGQGINHDELVSRIVKYTLK